MSEKAQNDWDVVANTLNFIDVPQEVRDAFDRLREVTEITIAGLNQRIVELEDEHEGWPIPESIRRA